MRFVEECQIDDRGHDPGRFGHRCRRVVGAEDHRERRGAGLADAFQEPSHGSRRRACVELTALVLAEDDVVGLAIDLAVAAHAHVAKAAVQRVFRPPRPVGLRHQGEGRNEHEHDPGGPCPRLLLRGPKGGQSLAGSAGLDDLGPIRRPQRLGDRAKGRVLVRCRDLAHTGRVVGSAHVGCSRSGIRSVCGIARQVRNDIGRRCGRLTVR